MTQHGPSPKKPRGPSGTRAKNLKRLLDLIKAGREVSRADLTRMTGLSPATVSSLTRTLEREGLIESVGFLQSMTGSGRRPMMLRVRPEGLQIPVFSLDRSGITYTLYDLDYKILEQHFRPQLPDRDGRVYIDIIADIVANRAELLNPELAAGLLISYPGAYLPEEKRYILTSLRTSFRRAAIDKLASGTGLHVYMGNSSMNLAYAEKKRFDARGRGIDDLIYINVCDGLGAGIISNGNALASDGRIAGEIGHITIVPGGRVCDCGNRGCLERYVNANEILAHVREAVSRDAGGANVAQLRALMEGPTLDMIGTADASDIRPVSDALDDIAAKLFTGICCMVAVTGIRCVVIGGLQPLGERFLDRLRKLSMGECPAVLMRGVQFLYSEVGADADNIGLAQYFMDKQFSLDT